MGSPIPPTDFNKTEKQMEVMDIVFKAASRGEFLSPKDIHSRLSYGKNCVYNSVISTLRYLRIHGMLVSVYGDHHGPYKQGYMSYLKPTPKAYAVLHPEKGT